MALYWYDSFQNFNSLAQMYPSSAVGAGSGFASGGAQRTGAQCLFFGSFNGYGFINGRCGAAGMPNGANHTDSTIGVAAKVGSLPVATGQTFLSLNDSEFSGGTWTDTQQVALQFNTTSGQLKLVRGSTTLATSTLSGYFVDGAWHFIEMYVLCNATTGAVTVRYDGAVVPGLQITGVNTVNSPNAWINGFTLGGMVGNFNGSSAYYNDLYVLDSSGPGPLNTFLGDVRVLYAQPSAAASPNQFTGATTITRNTAYTVGQYGIDTNGNTQKCTTAGTTASSAPTFNTSGTTADGTVTWTFAWTGSSNVNWIKDLAPDDLTTVLTDANVGDTELYTCAALSGVPAGITTAFAVGIDVRGERDQTTVRAVRTLVNSSGVQADNGVDLTLANGSFQSLKTVFPVDPNTGVAWTIANINAAKMGFKVSV